MPCCTSAPCLAHHGKLLVRDEPLATIVIEALEGFSSGRFASLAELQRLLEAQPVYPRDRKGRVHLQRIHDLLVRPIYAGYMDVEKWKLSLHPGKHVPLITFATWQKIQDRLKGRAGPPPRKDIREDFPLRGYVTCGCCGNPMTAGWSKGRSARYPYYFCQTKDCSQNRKSIRREEIEREFETLLGDIQPRPEIFFVAYEMLKDLWAHRQTNAAAQVQASRAELVRIERKTDSLMDRLVDADAPALVTAYERQIRKLEEEKVALTEQIARCGRPLASFDDTYRTAMTFLSNPRKLWDSERLEDKRLVLKLTFAGGLPYIKNKGYRTAETTLPFKMLAGISGSRKDLVVEAVASEAVSALQKPRNPEKQGIFATSGL